MNVQYLVESAIFKSVQDRQFQPKVNAGFQNFALNELNNVLDEWRDKIPYANEAVFNDISNLSATQFVEVDTVQYVIVNGSTNNVAFYLRQVSLNEYKQLQVIINLKAFPSVYYFDQLAQQINIYPLPSDQAYQFIVRGRIAQANLGLFDTIPANMPRFMQNALIYELAFRLAAEYGAAWDAKKETIRNGLMMALENKKEIDLSADINIVFGQPGVGQNAPFPYWYYISGGGG